MTQTTKTAAPPAGYLPLLIGEHAALDFLNSVLAPSGEWLDCLHDGDALVYWISVSNVVPEAFAAAAKAYTPQQRERLAAQARELREWFRALVLRWITEGKRGVRAADIERLNRLFSTSPLTQSVKRGGDGVELIFHRALGDPQSLIAALAEVCADLLANHHHDQVRKCENPECTLVFADTKRGPRRRWCSMSVCGNRMKVAAHRSRLKEW